MTFLGPLFVTLVIGFFFFCTVVAFAACAVGRDRELDELDYDNSHPDGFVRHYARVSTEVSK
ncbi:hypothetical protein HFO71_24230 [Rhizobium laguerreae]|uniref:hypothetical protein n=1 Tax=Rhizobium laguerreae TaxID=1076926 RepID=UPI001C909A21|nr:hypothetical protein [Rhizobium laguerreae]MBY3073425.1 hypothetical protein [Rhizobium laguerreae]